MISSVALLEVLQMLLVLVLPEEMSLLYTLVVHSIHVVDVA